MTQPQHGGPALPERIAGLAAVASNLSWSWNRNARALFRSLDPALWRRTQHNPIELLRRVASDLGVPLVGVGLFYTKGYSDQRLRLDGWQEDAEERFDVAATPLQPVRGPKGDPCLATVRLSGRSVSIGAWRVMVGRVPIFLLDTDLAQNDPADRGLSHRLYAGGPDLRLRQEWVLGVGGVRVLRALGYDPAAWHAN